MILDQRAIEFCLRRNDPNTSGFSIMATETTNRRAARKIVWDRLRRYVNSVMAQFSSSDELLRRVEDRATSMRSEQPDKR